MTTGYPGILKRFHIKKINHHISNIILNYEKTLNTPLYFDLCVMRNLFYIQGYKNHLLTIIIKQNIKLTCVSGKIEERVKDVFCRSSLAKGFLPVPQRYTDVRKKVVRDRTELQ